MGIQIDFQAKTAQAERDLASLNQSVRNIEKTSQRTTETFSKLARAFGTILAVGTALTSVRNLSSEFSTLENKIAQVVGRTKQLSVVQKQLFDIAEDTRGSLENTVSLYAALGRSTRQLNVSNANLLKVTKTVQQAVALSGADAITARAAIIQLGQGLSSGVLRGEELNSVLENTPRIGLAIADSLNVTTGQLRRLAAEGKVTSDVVFNALLKQTKQINKEFQVLNPTLGQAFTALNNNLKVFLNEFIRGLGIPAAMAESINRISKTLKVAALDAYGLGAAISIAFYKLKANVEFIIKPLFRIIAEFTKRFLQIIPSVQRTFTLRLIFLNAVRDFDWFIGKSKIFNTRVSKIFSRLTFGIISEKEFRAGPLQAFLRYQLTSLFKWESDLEKALRRLRRLNPANLIGSGFNIATFQRIFSTRTLVEYSRAFGDVAAEIKKNGLTIGTVFEYISTSISFGIQSFSRFIGLKPDTLFTLRRGLFEPFFITLNEVIRGLSDTSIWLFRVDKIVRSYLYPAFIFISETISDSVIPAFQKLIYLITSFVKIFANVFVRLIQIVKDFANQASIKEVFVVSIREARDSVATLFRILRSISDYALSTKNLKTFFSDALNAFSNFLEVLRNKSRNIFDIFKFKNKRKIKILDFLDLPRSFDKFLRKRVNQILDFAFSGGGKLKDFGKKLELSFRGIFNRLNVFRSPFENLKLSFETAIFSLKLEFKTFIERIRGLWTSFEDSLVLSKKKFNTVVEKVKDFARVIINYFKDIYYKIVGGSYWTDTIDGIINKSKGLLSGTRGYILQFEKFVLSTFININKKLANKFLNLDLDRLGQSQLAQKMSGRFIEKQLNAIFKVIDSGKGVSLLDEILFQFRNTFYFISMIVISSLQGVYEVIKDFGRKVVKVFKDIHQKTVGDLGTGYWSSLTENIVASTATLWTRASKGLRTFSTETDKSLRKTFNSNFEIKVKKLKVSDKVAFTVPVVETKSTAAEIENIFRRIGKAMIETLQSFPTALKVIALSFSGLFIALLLPSGKFKAYLLGLIISSIASSGSLIADEFTRSLTGGSFINALAAKFGQAAGMFVRNAILNLPQFLNALLGIVSSFTKAFLIQIPILGKAFELIFKGFSKVGLGGLSGLLEFGLLAKIFINIGKNVPGLKKVVGPLTAILGTITKIRNNTKGAYDKSGFIVRLLFGDYGLQIVSTLGLALSFFGAFDNIFINSPLAKIAAQGGLLYLAVAGKQGLVGITGIFSKVLGNSVGFIRTFLSQFDATKWISDTLFAKGSASNSSNIQKFIEGMFFRASTLATEGIASILKGPKDLFMTKMFGENPSATLQKMKNDIIGVFKTISNTGAKYLEKLFPNFGKKLPSDLQENLDFDFGKSIESGENFEFDFGEVKEAGAKVQEALESSLKPSEMGFMGRLWYGRAGKVALFAGLIAGLALFSARASAAADEQNEITVTWFDVLAYKIGEFARNNPINTFITTVAGSLLAIVGVVAVLKGSLVTAITTVSAVLAGSIVKLRFFAAGLGGLLGGLIGYSITDSMTGAITGALIGGALSSGIALAFGTMIKGAITGALLAVFSLKALGVALAVTVGVAVGAWFKAFFTGTSGNILTDMKKAFDPIKNVLGFESTKTTVSGLDRANETFLRANKVDLGYDLTTLDLSRVDSKLRKKLESNIAALNSRVEEIITEDLFTDEPESIRKELAKRISQINRQVDKAAAQNQITIENFDTKIIERFRLKGVTPVERFYNSVYKFFAESAESFDIEELKTLKRETYKRRQNRRFATPAEEEREAKIQERIDELRRIRDTDEFRTEVPNFLTRKLLPELLDSDIELKNRNVLKLLVDSGQKFQDFEFRLPEIDKQFLDSSAEMAGVFERIHRLDRGIAFEHNFKRALPFLERYRERLIALADTMVKATEDAALFNFESRQIANFQSGLNDLTNEFETINFTFDGSFFINDKDGFDQLQAMGRQAKLLSDSLKQVRTVEERNAILIRIKFLVDQAEVLKIRGLASDAIKDNFQINDVLGNTDLNFSSLTNQDLAALPEGFGSNIIKLTGDLQALLNAQKSVAVEARKRVGPTKLAGDRNLDDYVTIFREILPKGEQLKAVSAPFDPLLFSQIQEKFEINPEYEFTENDVSSRFIRQRLDKVFGKGYKLKLEDLFVIENVQIDQIQGNADEVSAAIIDAWVSTLENSTPRVRAAVANAFGLDVKQFFKRFPNDTDQVNFLGSFGRTRKNQVLATTTSQIRKANADAARQEADLSRTAKNFSETISAINGLGFSFTARDFRLFSDKELSNIKAIVTKIDDLEASLTNAEQGFDSKLIRKYTDDLEAARRELIKFNEKVLASKPLETIKSLGISSTQQLLNLDSTQIEQLIAQARVLASSELNLVSEEDIGIIRRILSEMRIAEREVERIKEATTDKSLTDIISEIGDQFNIQIDLDSFLRLTPEVRRALQSRAKEIKAALREADDSKMSEEAIAVYKEIADIASKFSIVTLLIDTQKAVFDTILGSVTDGYNKLAGVFENFTVSLKDYKKLPKEFQINVEQKSIALDFLEKISDIRGPLTPDDTINSEIQKLLSELTSSNLVATADQIKSLLGDALDTPFERLSVALTALREAVEANTLVQGTPSNNPKMARGGFVSGPGTGTSDSITTDLSNGEFVIKKTSTDKYFSLLNAINSDANVSAELEKLRWAKQGKLKLPKLSSRGLELFNSEDYGQLFLNMKKGNPSLQYVKKFSDGGFVSNLKQYGSGVYSGVKTQFSDLYEMITNPRETAANLASLGRELYNDPVKTSSTIASAARVSLENAMQDPKALGQFVGENLNPFTKLSKVPKRDITAYHGSRAKFDSFDNSLVGSAHGTVHGAGHNFTTSKDLAKAYAASIDPDDLNNPKLGFLYKIEIPDTTLEKLIPVHNTLSQPLTKMLLPDTSSIIQSLKEKFSFRSRTLRQLAEEPDLTGQRIQSVLRSAYNDIEISQILKQKGFKGFNAPYGRENQIHVLFDNKDFTLLDRIPIESKLLDSFADGGPVKKKKSFGRMFEDFSIGAGFEYADQFEGLSQLISNPEARSALFQSLIESKDAFLQDPKAFISNVITAFGSHVAKSVSDPFSFGQLFAQIVDPIQTGKAGKLNNLPIAKASSKAPNTNLAEVLKRYRNFSMGLDPSGKMPEISALPYLESTTDFSKAIKLRDKFRAIPQEAFTKNIANDYIQQLADVYGFNVSNLHLPSAVAGNSLISNKPVSASYLSALGTVAVGSPFKANVDALQHLPVFMHEIGHAIQAQSVLGNSRLRASQVAGVPKNISSAQKNKAFLQGFDDLNNSSRIFNSEGLTPSVLGNNSELFTYGQQGVLSALVSKSPGRITSKYSAPFKNFPLTPRLENEYLATAIGGLFYPRNGMSIFDLSTNLTDTPSLRVAFGNYVKDTLANEGNPKLLKKLAPHIDNITDAYINTFRDLQGFYIGGTITGPGTGTSDSILARVSNGEFIVNANSTRKYGSLLEQINADSLPGFFEGGEVVTSAKTINKQRDQQTLAKFSFDSERISYQKEIIDALKDLPSQIAAESEFAGVSVSLEQISRANQSQTVTLKGLSGNLFKTYEALQKARESGINIREAQLAYDAAVVELEHILETSLRNLAKTIKDAGKAFADSISESINNNLKDILKGKKSPKEALDSVLEDLSSSIIDSFVNGLMDPITGPEGIITQLSQKLGENLFKTGLSVFGKQDPMSDQEVKARVPLDFGIPPEMSDKNLLNPLSGLAPKVGTPSDVTTEESPLDGIQGLSTNILSVKNAITAGTLETVNSVGGLGGIFQQGLGSLSQLFGGSGGGAGGWMSAASSIIGLFAADGGYVKGPGTGTSDSIPAMISNGEFVVNAKATKENLRLLSAINAGKVSRFAEGGLVSDVATPLVMPMPLKDSALPGKPNSSQQFNINFTGDISRQTKSEMLRMIPQLAGSINTYNKEIGYKTT